MWKTNGGQIFGQWPWSTFYGGFSTSLQESNSMIFPGINLECEDFPAQFLWWFARKMVPLFYNSLGL
jgi:hypothetical protein